MAAGKSTGQSTTYKSRRQRRKAFESEAFEVLAAAKIGVSMRSVVHAKIADLMVKYDVAEYYLG